MNNLEKIKNRISNLEKIGYQDKLNIDNMRKSKTTLLLFLDEVILLDYYSVVLDDHGYYTLRMKNENILFLLTFKNDYIHYYVNFKNCSNNGNITLKEFFSKIDKKIYEMFFSRRNDKN